MSKIVHPITVPVGRLSSEEAATILGFEQHDIAVLMRYNMLKPLGRPVPSARKFFARTVIMDLAGDPEWLDKATRCLYQHWKKQNAKRRQPSNGATERPFASSGTPAIGANESANNE